MQHPEQPWVDDQDPFIDYYGLIDKSELQFVRENFASLSGSSPVFNHLMIDFNRYYLLLDFSDYFNDESQFLLYKDLCSVNNNAFLYWLPLDNYKDEFLFENYMPKMIAKTPRNNKVLKKASLSFMQMQNGGLFLMEESGLFFAIIVDGYYMMALVDKKYDIGNINAYLENWSVFEHRLDTNCSNILFGFLKNLNCQTGYN